jgi:hypothetical protein
MNFDINKLEIDRTLMDHHRRMAEEAHDFKNPVVKAYESLLEYIQEFEKNLDIEHEVGMRLVSFGNELTFHVHKIGYTKPNIITFYGVTNSSEQIQLVQHVSQLSFVLMAVKKLEEVPCRVMGFIKDD